MGKGFVRSRRSVWIIILIGIVSVLAEIILGFHVLPLHISAATCCYIFFLMCIVSCLLIGKKHASSAAIASSEIGILNAFLTLLSGSIWARFAWGVYWVWEPRLTGMLLTTMFFVSWRIAVGILGESAVRNRKLTASLIVLGLPGMFFTHAAVRLFGGMHPSSTSDLNSEPAAWWAFALMITGIVCISCGLFLKRYVSLEERALELEKKEEKD